MPRFPITKRLLERARLEAPARWVWERRPSNRSYRRWSRWLREADRLDNERMRLVLTCLLDDDSNCIDVGASGGVFLREMVRLSPKGKHLAYEPLPGEYDRLVQRFPNVNVRNVAASNVRGRANFVFVHESPGWSGLRDYGVPVQNAHIESIDVETVTLDEDLPSDYVPSLIKIDVNGAEREVLEGAIRTLRTHQPVVLFEHGQAAAAYGTTSDMIFELLCRQSGLKIFDLEGNGPFDDKAFSQAATVKWNFLARP